MRPNVMRGGSFAGGMNGEGSAVDAFSSASTANMRSMGSMMGRQLADGAQMIASEKLSREGAFWKAGMETFLGRGQTLGSGPPNRGSRDNSDAFQAIGGALREIVGFNRGSQGSDRPSGSGSAPYWRPSGNDGWGQTQLGARGSNESMVSKAIAGFSFL